MQVMARWSGSCRGNVIRPLALQRGRVQGFERMGVFGGDQ